MAKQNRKIRSRAKVTREKEKDIYDNILYAGNTRDRNHADQVRRVAKVPAKVIVLYFCQKHQYRTFSVLFKQIWQALESLC